MSANVFRRWRRASAAVTLLLAFFFAAAAAASPFDQTFDLDGDPDFRDYRKVIRQYVLSQRLRLPTEACVVGLVVEGGGRLAWVLWPKGRRVILWEGEATDLAMAHRTIRIPADVVRDESEVNGSTYIVTRAWLDGLTATCNNRGAKVRITREKN
jgi:hypothetical protein